MGEYAHRKSDGAEIKIGTCKRMYYLRLEDKSKVIPLVNSDYGIFYRLPFPDEDKIKPGDYDRPERGLSLWKYTDTDRKDIEYFTAPNTIDSPGNIQLTHPCGLLVNLPCYHGEKLPESTKDIKVFWNGKTSIFYELVHIKAVNGITNPVIKCNFCREMWSCTWEEILPYVKDSCPEMYKRLLKYI